MIAPTTTPPPMETFEEDGGEGGVGSGTEGGGGAGNGDEGKGDGGGGWRRW